jgi:hypothetical protein
VAVTTAAVFIPADFDPKKHYRCACCGEYFLKTWTDEEAHAEFAERFPHDDIAEGEVVCAECNELFEQWARANGLMP